MPPSGGHRAKPRSKNVVCLLLTTIDAGTRVLRFMIQDILGLVSPAWALTRSWRSNLLATGLAVAGWGYFLYQGVADPLGGINTLWPLFGIANQMLAAIALMLACVILIKMKRERFLWVPLVPTLWLLVCTLTAGWQKLFDANPKIGFLAHAERFRAAIERGELVAPAKDIAQMQQILLNDRIDAVMCALFVLVVLMVLSFSLRVGWRAWRNPMPSTCEMATTEVAHV